MQWGTYWWGSANSSIQVCQKTQPCYSNCSSLLRVSFCGGEKCSHSAQPTHGLKDISRVCQIACLLLINYFSFARAAANDGQERSAIRLRALLRDRNKFPRFSPSCSREARDSNVASISAPHSAPLAWAKGTATLYDTVRLQDGFPLQPKHVELSPMKLF